MDAKTFDKSKLPSRHVTEGASRAPHRSYYYAMGLTEKQIHRPFVGVVSCWNEAAPCNIALMRQAQSAKKGVHSAGGTPREFCTITVTDGIAMGHQGMKASLISREVIANSIELTMRGHCYDAMVGLAGCDKSLPGVMMAMLRLNVPSVFMYGGSILPGKFKGKDVTVVDVFEAVGQHSAGKMSDKDLHTLECHACPGAGACGGQFTANTMAMVSEAIGLALPGSAGAPAPYESRDEYAVASGKAVMRLLSDGIRPRDIVTRKAFENAATIVAATGGSTNAGLHLPAMAHECGIELDLMDVAAIFKRTPYIADLKPGGKYVAKDVYDIGGIPQVMRALLDGGYLHEDCLTVTGKTIKQNTRESEVQQEPDGCLSGFQTHIANGRSRGAAGLVGAGWRRRQGGRHEDAEVPRSRARVRLRGGLLPGGREPPVQGRRHPHHPLRGPQGRPRHARDALHHGGALRPGRGRAGRSHHGRQVLRGHARLLHRPRRARRRPWAARSRWFRTATSSPSTPRPARSIWRYRRPSFAKRRRTWKAPPNPYQSGALRKYADQVGPAHKGAVTHAGGKAEVVCYADI